jgi:hypothetical protein
MTLFRSRYRIETTRLKNHSYKYGWYFVTICTRHRVQWFGEIRQGKMVLSEAGKIIHNEWMKTASIRSSVTLDAWCIMPDHLHGILIIRRSFNDNGESVVGGGVRGAVETPRRGVSTKYSIKFPPKNWSPGSLGAIINQFKSICTKRIRDAGFPEFQWQSRYHDRIIRSPGGLNAIRKYICANPEHWTKETIPWDEDGNAWHFDYS